VWIALLGGIGVGALAAVLAFKIHSGGFVVWSHAPTPAVETAQAPAATATPVAASPGEWKNADIPGATNTHAPSPVPQGAPAAGGSHPAAATGVHSLVGAHEASAKSVVAAAAAPEEPAAPPATKPAPVAAPAPEPTSQDKLVAMMQKAVRTESGPQEALVPTPAAAPAATATANAGNLPVKPAAGAIMGALGTVMPAARYCLGPDDPVSRATITFKSDGSVENVVITGDAAGQPAESCIKARLMEAKVPPFSSPHFTWTVPVRPAN